MPYCAALLCMALPAHCRHPDTASHHFPAHAIHPTPLFPITPPPSHPSPSLLLPPPPSRSHPSPVDLVVDLWNSLRLLVADTRNLDIAMDNAHPSREDTARPPVDTLDLGDRAILVSSPDVGSDVRVVAGEVDDDAVGGSANVSRRLLMEAGALGTQGRRLLQQMTIPLPAGFTAQPASSIPDLLIPVVWHVHIYKWVGGVLWLAECTGGYGCWHCWCGLV